MKRLTTFIFAMLTMFSIANAQLSTDSVKVTKDINAEAFELGKEVLKSTAVGAGDMLTTGYEIIVFQQTVKAITYLIPLLFSFLLLYLAVRFYGQATTGSENKLLPAALFAIVGLACFAFGGFHYKEIVYGLLNPDFMAMKEVFEFGEGFMKAKGGN
jgi:hypothetical protein